MLKKDTTGIIMAGRKPPGHTPLLNSFTRKGVTIDKRLGPGKNIGSPEWEKN